MKQYLLSIYRLGGDPPPPEALDWVRRSIQAERGWLRISERGSSSPRRSAIGLGQRAPGRFDLRPVKSSISGPDWVHKTDSAQEAPSRVPRSAPRPQPTGRPASGTEQPSRSRQVDPAVADSASVDVGLRNPLLESERQAVVALRRGAVRLVTEGAALDHVAAAAALHRVGRRHDPFSTGSWA